MAQFGDLLDGALDMAVYFKWSGSGCGGSCCCCMVWF